MLLFSVLAEKNTCIKSPVLFSKKEKEYTILNDVFIKSLVLKSYYIFWLKCVHT